MTVDIGPDAFNRVAYIMLTFTDKSCDDDEVCRRLALLNDVLHRPVEILSSMPLADRLLKE